MVPSARPNKDKRKLQKRLAKTLQDLAEQHAAYFSCFVGHAGAHGSEGSLVKILERVIPTPIFFPESPCQLIHLLLAALVASTRTTT